MECKGKLGSGSEPIGRDTWYRRNLERSRGESGVTREGAPTFGVQIVIWATSATGITTT